MTEQFFYDIATQVLPVVGGAIIGYLWNKSKGLTEQREAVYGLARATAKMELLRVYENAQKTGEISTHEWQIAEEIYKNYHILGGNGQGTGLIEAIRKVKINDR